jgi:hypothetical protein
MGQQVRRELAPKEGSSAIMRPNTLFKKLKLPEAKLIAPGVIECHSTYIEHRREWHSGSHAARACSTVTM